LGDNQIMSMNIGDTVIIVLHSPREKLLGVLGEISSAGVKVRSIDLSYFDDWCRAIAAREAHLPMTDNFFPMWRVERMSLDEAADGVPSMAEHFEARTGHRLSDQ
jgi:hypothetical protein